MQLTGRRGSSVDVVAPSVTSSGLSRRDRRLTLAAATLGSFVVLLDSTVVSIALPAIHGDLGGGLESQQWIVNAYLLMLGSLI